MDPRLPGDSQALPIAASDAGRLGEPVECPSPGRLLVDGAAALAGMTAALVLPGHAGIGPAAVCAAFWWVAVVVVIRSDLQRFIIPNEASAAIAALGLIEVGIEAWLAGQPFAAAASSVAMALAHGFVAFGLFWGVGTAFRRFSGQDGLGFGDVKLAGASAIWLDAGNAALALEIAALAAVAVTLIRHRGVARRSAAIPFGAFLAPAAWLVFVLDPVLHPLASTLP